MVRTFGQWPILSSLWLEITDLDSNFVLSRLSDIGALRLQWLTHTAKRHALDRKELVDSVLAALTAETALFNTTESSES